MEKSLEEELKAVRNANIIAQTKINSLEKLLDRSSIDINDYKEKLYRLEKLNDLLKDTLKEVL